MDIVIIGDGKVGHKLAMQLSGESYNVTLIDQCEKKLADTVNEMDVSCVVGDGASAEIQKKADVPGADLVIACTSTDEMNMFCCLLARRLGAKQTIARVRNPVYSEQIHLLKGDAMEILKTLEEPYDMIFVDAAKAQYIAYFPEVMRLLNKDGMLISDNVLQNGGIMESRFAVERRDRTIHSRMREYLYLLKHDERLETAVVPIGDGASVSVKKE